MNTNEETNLVLKEEVFEDYKTEGRRNPELQESKTRVGTNCPLIRVH